MPARGWRRGVSEGVEPSEWTLHDKIDEKRPFRALKNEDEPPGPGRPEGGAPLPGGPSGGRPGDVRTPRERGSSRPPPPGPPGSRGGRPAAGGLERRCSYRSSPGDGVAARAWRYRRRPRREVRPSSGGRYIQMGPRGVRAPDARTSSCPGKRPLGSSCPRGTGTPTSNRTPAYRSRTPTHQGKIANGNSTSAYRSECVGEQGADVPVRRRQADARLGRPPRAATRGRPWCRRRGVLGRPRARGSAP